MTRQVKSVRRRIRKFPHLAPSPIAHDFGIQFSILIFEDLLPPPGYEEWRLLYKNYERHP